MPANKQTTKRKYSSGGKKDHEFHEVFKIFDGRNNNCSKLFMYKPGNYDQINTNNKLILCLKIMESTLIDMFSTPSITI